MVLLFYASESLSACIFVHEVAKLIEGGRKRDREDFERDFQA